MLGFLKRWIEVRRRAEVEAERLIAEHGEEAWSLVYQICRDVDYDEETRRFYSRVRQRIETKLGIPPRVDTATRYLEDG